MMDRRVILVLISAAALAVAAACGGGSGGKTPAATPTPQQPGPADVIGDWVRANRNVDFVGECASAKPGVDVGKLCATQIGSRGTRRAFTIGPTFSGYTALAILEQKPEGWTVLSVKNRDLSAGQVPGIDWPLSVGDQVVVVGLAEDDCLSVRAQPTQRAERMICIADGTIAIVQEGPVDAENLTWWRITGAGFNGWSAGTWLRLPEAIAQALQPQATPTPIE